MIRILGLDVALRRSGPSEFMGPSVTIMSTKVCELSGESRILHNRKEKLWKDACAPFHTRN